MNIKIPRYAVGAGCLLLLFEGGEAGCVQLPLEEATEDHPAGYALAGIAAALEVDGAGHLLRNFDIPRDLVYQKRRRCKIYLEPHNVSRFVAAFNGDLPDNASAITDEVGDIDEDGFEMSWRCKPGTTIVRLCRPEEDLRCLLRGRIMPYSNNKRCLLDPAADAYRIDGEGELAIVPDELIIAVAADPEG